MVMSSSSLSTILLLLSITFYFASAHDLHDAVNLTCTDNEFTITLQRHHFELLWNDFSLIDPSCKVSVDGSAQFSFISKRYDECGTTVETNATHFAYKNILKASIGDATDMITRQTNNTVEIVCMIERELTTSLLNSVNVTAPDHIIVKEDGFGTFELAYNLYKTHSYSTKYQDSEYPVPKKLRDILYMELVLTTSNQQVRMNPRECYATPTNDKDDAMKHYFVKDSCPNDTTFVQGPRAATNFKFHLQSFQFTSDQNKIQSVFFHCTAIVCKVDIQTGVCQWNPDTCSFQFTRKRRDVSSSLFGNNQRSIRSYEEGISQPYTVSSNMFLLLPEDDTLIDELTKVDDESSENINVITIAAATVSLFLSTCIGGAVVLYIRSKRRQNKTKTEGNEEELGEIDNVDS